MPVDAPAPVAAPADDAAMALVEVAHERDVSIARASEAEERERLIRDRLASLAPLERRVEDAERRVRDAERRLDEISARIEAATRGEIAPALDASPEPAGHDDAEPHPPNPPMTSPVRPLICEIGSPARPRGSGRRGTGGSSDRQRVDGVGVAQPLDHL